MNLLQRIVRIFALAGILSLLTMTATARQVRIEGRVTTSGSGAPVAQASVMLEPLGRGTATDTQGRFAFERVPVGEYVIVVSHVSHVPLSRTVVAGTSGVGPVRIELDLATLPLNGLVVEQASMTGGLAGIAGIPGSAHYISARELERFAHQDIHRILRGVPGLNIQEEDGYGLRPNIGIRGTGSERSSRVTIMEDGVPITPAPYAASAAYFFPVVGRMHAVEVRKGASQIRYGPSTTGGAINLISSPIPDRRRLQGRMQVGHDRNSLLHLRGGETRGRIGYLVEGYRSRTAGFKELDGGGDTGFERRDLLAKFRVSSGPGARFPQSLLLKVGWSDERSNETYLGLTDTDFAVSPLRRYAGSANDRMDADQRQVVLRHAATLAPSVNIVSTLYHTRTHRNWYKLDRLRTDVSGAVSIADLMRAPEAHPRALDAVTGDGNAGDALLDVKANNRSYRVYGVQTDLSWASPVGQVDAGVRLHRDEMDRFQWIDAYRMDGVRMHLETPGEPGTDSNRIERAKAFSGWVQQRLDTGRISIQPGLRFEAVEQTRNDFGRSDPLRTGGDLAVRRNVSYAWMPGLGLSFRLNPGWTAFSGVHRGYGPPGTREGTRPERSINVEAGSRFDRNGARLEAVAYLTDYQNLLGADLAAAGGGGTTDLFNGGEALVRGVELSAERNLGFLTNWVVSLPVRVVYSFTDARFTSAFSSEFDPWGDVQDGDELPYVPRHQGSLLVGVESGRFSSQVSFAYSGRLRTVAGRGTPDETERVDAHVVVDASAEWMVAGSVTVFGSIRNVGDSVYIAARRPAGIRPGLPRTVMIGLLARL